MIGRVGVGLLGYMMEGKQSLLCAEGVGGI